MYVTNNHLKQGMILEKDILYQDNNIETILLTAGQVLNNIQIKKMKLLNIEGASIKNDAFSNIQSEPEINAKLRKKALKEIRNVYSELETTGKISQASITIYNYIVSDLINEISEKMALTNGLLKFKNYDEYTFQHCLNVASLNITTGISMELSEIMLHDLGMIGLLHDIGKTLIPIEIVRKPGKLTPEEFDLMKAHPINSVKLLNHMVSAEILNGIEYHHETLEGSGYPHGKTKDEIPLYAKITSVCDVYHALSSDRTYRKSCFPNEVIEYMMGCADTHFDYDILKIFLKNAIAYPVGSFVKLSNNIKGIVIKNYKDNTMRPIIRILNPDNTSGGDIDLLNDLQLMNVTIAESEYEYDDIDYSSTSKEFNWI